MIEEAFAVSWRDGVKVSKEEIPDNCVVNIYDLAKHGIPRNEELIIGDTPENHADLFIESTHVAAPEVSHPGESQSNGLAERSVGEFVDQLRTLKPHWRVG